LLKVEISREKSVWRSTYGPLDVALDIKGDKPIVRQDNKIDVHTSGPTRVNDWNLGDLLAVDAETGK
jgi:hypothetical protein